MTPAVRGTSSRPIAEGHVRFRGMRTWYRIAGDLRSDGRGPVPLLLLHGGPGMPSDALQPLDALARDGRAVVAYDQIGCGRSDRPRNPTLWTMATFLDELTVVRRELGLRRVHLLGWSWGGMLALEHVLSRPDGVVSLTLASSPASAPLWTAEVRRLRDGLPDHVTRAMRRFEDGYRPRPPSRQADRPRRPRSGPSQARIAWVAHAGRAVFGLLARPRMVRLAALASAVPGMRRAAYEVVNAEFIKRHVMLGSPRDAPLCVFRSFAGMNRAVYEAMWGPSEYFPTGVLRDWDVTDRLPEIAVPTLVTSGRHDEATPRQMRLLHDGIPDVRWVIFEHSAHAALIEESDRYRDVLDEFLRAAEQVSNGGEADVRPPREASLEHQKATETE